MYLQWIKTWEGKCNLVEGTTYLGMRDSQGGLNIDMHRIAGETGDMCIRCQSNAHPKNAIGVPCFCWTEESSPDHKSCAHASPLNEEGTGEGRNICLGVGLSMTSEAKGSLK